MKKHKIEKVNSMFGECLIVNDRYIIYLDCGVVYDTKYANDIPAYVFQIRDIAMLVKSK